MPLRLLLTCLALWFFASPARGREEMNALPGISLDLDKSELRLKAKVCLTDGILEYVAVSPRGKTYESVFELEAEPSNIHASLLLLGLDPCGMGTDEKKDEDPPHLILCVQWEGSDSEEPLESLLLNRKTKAVADPISWIFSGSLFGTDEAGKALYVADRERSVIAIWPDATALLNPLEKGLNPYRGEANGYQVRTEAIRPLGTACWLIVRKEAVPPALGRRSQDETSDPHLR